ncbi:MAG: hypothetical protein KC441_18075 [Anaerolineales bacterium]|nr:hypothetical protein [Anaerolineales bacterium]
MDELVTTVLGPLAPEALGITDGHNHLWIEPVASADPEAPVLNDEAAIRQELQQYRAAGGGTIVDCQPGGCGRNGRYLAQLSHDSGVHVVACTGFHLRRYYPPHPMLWQMTAEAASDLFVGELLESLYETQDTVTPVRAGFLKIAGEASFEQTPRHLLEAAAAACRATGCAIEMHTEKGLAVEAFLEFFLAQQVDPQRLVFCHVDKRPDFGFHEAIAQTGAMLEYDTFYRTKYDPETAVWPLLEKMIAAGLETQIVLATDMAYSHMWQTMGGQPGLAAFVTQIRSRLAKMELAAATVNNLTGGNIARRLAVPHKKESHS